MGKPSSVIVLAEDQCHQRFIWRYLERLNYSRHEVRNEPLPSGRGSGEQWVRNRYADAVKAYRMRSARAQTALIVVIDADAHSVNERCRQLEAALELEEINPRGEQEKISHVIPKRNIETWILCLNGEHVDEECDYKGQVNDNQIKPAALVLFEWTRPNARVGQNCIDSINRAIPEVQRL